MTDRSIDVDGVRIAFSDVGEGPITVYLHGFTGDRSTMEVLADAIGGRRIIIDLVGHGDSDTPNEAEAFTMAGMVNQVRRVIESQTQSPVDIVGYSMGGRTALSLAVAHPTMVRAMSLIGATPGLETTKERRLRIIADTKLAHLLLTEGLEVFIDHWMGLAMWESLRAAIGEDAWAESREQRLRNNPSGLAASLIGSGTGVMPPLHQQLKELTMPIQLVVGELDTKFRAIAAEMASALPNAKVAVASGAGHAMHLERPEACASVIARFLGR
jgi:2-succinyl-6-hydroxy-2,4-cyclohexadiene-1-carboxylate synthase